MKKIITIWVIWSFSWGCLAQKTNKAYEEAQKLYKKMAYTQALDFYKKALEIDTSSILIKEKIAHCYRKLQDTPQAEVWYAKVVFSPITDPEDKLYYAQALASNNKHQDAQLWYNAYAKQVKDDSRPLAFALAYQNMESFYKDSTNFQVNLAPFNSTEDDFSPVFYGKKIVFVSNRHSQNERFKWDNSSFLDLYVYSNGKTNVFQEKLNSPYHEGPLAFFPKGDSVIFTRNATKKPSKGEKINRLNLYIAYKQSDGTWGKEKEFAHNSEEFSTMHPALSPDGKTLYFVSDRVGSLGGMDIWVSYYENNKWTSPQNLGETINTRGNEAFPYVDFRGSLYLASNGHSGLGGLDVFIAENVGGKFISPQNLGYPINSIKDDFGFIFNPKSKKGYFSSNRAGGVGKDDIYEMTVKQNLNNFSELILATRNDDTEAIIPSVEVQIKSDQKTTLNFSDANGNIKYYFNKKFHYEIIAKKEGYELKHLSFIPEQIVSHQEDDTLEVDLLPEKKAITILKFVDELTNQPVEVSIIILEKNTQKMIASWQTEGKWEKPLDKGIYEIRATAKGYVYQVDTLQVADKDAKTQKNIYLKQLKKQVVFQTKIQYEKHEYKPNKKSVQEVESLVKLLEENPKLSIKIIGYSQDSKQEIVNKNLAEKRAKFIQDYLVSKKIEKKRLNLGGASSKTSSIEVEILDTEENPNENKEQPIKSIFDE